MNKKTSAGILLYRKEENQLQVFLVHTGGPYGYNKDNGYWSIPKGEFGQNDNVFYTALREFKEETGLTIQTIKLRVVKEDLKNVIEKFHPREIEEEQDE